MNSASAKDTTTKDERTNVRSERTSCESRSASRGEFEFYFGWRANEALNATVTNRLSCVCVYEVAKRPRSGSSSSGARQQQHTHTHACSFSPSHTYMQCTHICRHRQRSAQLDTGSRQRSRHTLATYVSNMRTKLATFSMLLVFQFASSDADADCS